jgi:signal transduction histidine kinase
MNTFKILILYFSIFVFNNAQAQPDKLDILERELKLHTTDDTAKVNLLNKIAYAVFRDNAEKARNYATQAGELSDKLLYPAGKTESVWLTGLSYYALDKPTAFEYLQRALEMAQKTHNKYLILKCLNSFAIYYRAIGEIPKAIEFFQKSIAVAEELDNKSELVKSWLNLSLLYKKDENYDKAIEGYKITLRLAENEEDKSNEATCLNSLGVLSSYKGNHPAALEYFQRYLKIQEEQSDSVGIYGAIGNIGNVYLDISDYSRALNYYQRALKIAEKLNKKRMLAGCYGNIGTTYQRMNSSKALGYFRKALVLSEEVGDKTIIASVLIYIGDFYLPRGQLNTALNSYTKALQISEANGMDRVVCGAMNNVGTVYLKKKKYATALTYTLKALEIADKLKVLNTRKDIHYQLSEIYEATNDYKKAYQNYKLYKELNDSLFSTEKVRRITALEYTYKYEKEIQATEILNRKKDVVHQAEQKHQRVVILLLIVCVVTMSVVVIYVYRSFRIKKKTNILLTKQKNEIEEKNAELLELNKEISKQKDEIITINAEIETKNNKLQELNATKDKFFSIIAHDLKNPFNAILGFSDLLVSAGNRYPQERTMEMIGMINTSAHNAYSLLENLLEWSRSQVGGIEFNPQHLDLKDLVCENQCLCDNMAKEKDISIVCDIPDDLTIYADKNMLNTIMRNLITNAIKFTHKGGNINITVIWNSTDIIISVQDTGVGMDENTKHNLFKINEKSSVSGTENESGTGLGLIICKEFIEKHNGRIWVESELGKGSDFKLSLPIKH